MLSTSNPLTTAGRRLKPARIFFSLAVVILLLSSARAQGVGTGRDLSSTAGGNFTIQGRVYLPDAQAKKRFRVRLDSPNFTGQSTQTDEDGAFRFSGLVSGQYTITVEVGKEYEPAVEYVSLDRQTLSTPQNSQVLIYLRLKGSGPAANAGLAGVPKTAADLYTKALESMKKGDGKKAVEQLNEAVTIHPQFVLALTELGVQYLKQRELDKAVTSLRAALKLAPEDFAARLAYGIVLQEKKEFVEAEKELREVVKKNDASPLGHMYLGMTLISLNKLDEAEKELQRAVTLKGGENLAQAHKLLGGLYWKKGQLKQAADELELYLKLSPKAPDAERIRATVKELRSKS